MFRLLLISLYTLNMSSCICSVGYPLPLLDYYLILINCLFIYKSNQFLLEGTVFNRLSSCVHATVLFVFVLSVSRSYFDEFLASVAEAVRPDHNSASISLTTPKPVGFNKKALAARRLCGVTCTERRMIF